MPCTMEGQISAEQQLLRVGSHSCSTISKSSLGPAGLECDGEAHPAGGLLTVSCPAQLIRSSWRQARPPSSRYSRLSSSQNTSAPSTKSFISTPSWNGFYKISLKESKMSLLPSKLFPKPKRKTFFVRADSSRSSHSRSRYRHEDIPFAHDETFVTLNVSGRKFKINDYFLAVYPETLLGSDKRAEYYDWRNNEYFFDRDPESFRHIWNFYCTGKLHFPKDECPELFIDEANFFGISESHMCDYCWTAVFKPAVRRLEFFKDGINAGKFRTVKKETQVTESVRERVWYILENPEISFLSKVINVINMFIIITSIVVNIVETVPCSPSLNICKEQNEPEYFYLDTVCVAFFTVEYLVRLMACPNRLRYFIHYMSMIDLLAILPYYINLMLSKFYGTKLEIDALTTLRILRIFRIFKVMRHSKRLQQLTESIKSSSTELGFILFMYIIVVVLCASIIYFAESSGNTVFVSIPEAMWYSVVTSTTVGYGDIVPQTLVGKLIGSVCCLVGVLVIALPVPILQVQHKPLHHPSSVDHH